MAIKLIKVQKKILGGIMTSDLFVAKAVVIDKLGGDNLTYAIAGFKESDLPNYALKPFQYTKASFYITTEEYVDSYTYVMNSNEDAPEWNMLITNEDATTDLADKEAYASFLRNSCSLVGVGDLVADPPSSISGLDSALYGSGKPLDDSDMYAKFLLSEMMKENKTLGSFYIHCVVYRTSVEIANPSDGYIALD